MGKNGGIGVANGEGNLGLLSRAWPVPFSLNQVLRLIVVGSVLSLTFVGALFVCSLLRVLVKPCSRFTERICRGHIAEYMSYWQTQPVF